MAIVEEIPPLMVLAESPPERMVFRFRGRLWGWVTLLIGAPLVAGSVWFLFVRDPSMPTLALTGSFGLIFLYSSLYSFTADQFLIVDGATHSVRFHKKNLFGSVGWERGGDQFKEIKVFRASPKVKNWTIMLVAVDGGELFVGENEFGSLHHENAVELAGRVGTLAGIRVNDVNL